MSWKKLLEDGSLQEKRVSFEEVENVLNKANKCLKAAEILINKNIDESAFKEAYDAMVLASRALMFSLGVRPRTIGSHVITLKFCDLFLGSDCKLLVDKFKKMKQKRNYLIYGSGLMISGSEAKNAIKSAKEFIRKIEKIIQARNPQKKLM